MATFPSLKSGAVAQYPSQRSLVVSTQVMRFVDQSEQSFVQSAAPRHAWSIKLDLLDEGELETLAQFFVAQGGRAGTFTFVDPWDQTSYANCSFATDELATVLAGVGRGQGIALVKENG